MFEGLQAEPGASTEVQLLDLGTYSANRIPDMFALDFYTHLRWDILAPRGPLHHDVPGPNQFAKTLVNQMEFMLILQSATKKGPGGAILEY